MNPLPSNIRKLEDIAIGTIPSEDQKVKKDI